MLDSADVARSTRKDGDHQTIRVSSKSFSRCILRVLFSVESIQQQKNISSLDMILLLVQFYFFCAKGLYRKTQLAGTGKNWELC